MYNKLSGFKPFYDRKFGAILPWWALWPLLGCFVLNCVVYWFTQWLMEGAYHYDLTLPVDRALPVSSWWVSIYILSYGFWALNYILIGRQSREACYRLAFADYISKIVCGIIFIALPTTNVRPELGHGFWDTMLGFIYEMDSPTNLFPSIHCLVSWLCFVGLRGTKIPLWYRLVSAGCAIAICASTQFTKQHYIVDVVGGIALAEIAFWASSYFVRRMRLNTADGI